MDAIAQIEASGFVPDNGAEVDDAKPENLMILFETAER